MNPPLILYPVACDKNGFAIHIDDWERGQEVTCFGCGKDLVGRLPHDGIKPTAHFAHKADAVCSGETALHEAAKAAIVHSHGRGTLQALSWECPHCKRYWHSTDLRSLALAEEKRPCEGVVSDVLGTAATGEPRVAIEVIVTHDIEAKTCDRYRACGIDVFSFYANWGNVGDIARGAVSLEVDHRFGAVDTFSCDGCQAILRDKLEWEQRERQRKATQWWARWDALWRSVGNEAKLRALDRFREVRERRAREEAWWTKWTAVWPRMIQTTIDTWWIRWHRLWIDLGVEYMRPYRWEESWITLWEAIGNKYAFDEVERYRITRYLRDQREVWWATWIRVWKDIGQRESGAMAAWKPICRKCRDDLRADHRCPRVETLVGP